MFWLKQQAVQTLGSHVHPHAILTAFKILHCFNIPPPPPRTTTAAAATAAAAASTAPITTTAKFLLTY